MAQTRGPQLAPGPVFRRVVQHAPADPVDSEGDVMERTGGQPSQRVSNWIQQSVDNLHETDARLQREPVEPKPRLVIAVDFGTTYSTVSFAKIDVGVDSTTYPMNKIRCIDNYEWAEGFSDARANGRAENVPTKLLYLGPGTLDGNRSDNTEPDADTESESDDDSLCDMDVPSMPSPRYNGRRRRRPKTTWSRAEGTTVYWGFRVQNKQKEAHVLAKDPNKEAVELIKLMLGEDQNADPELRKKRQQLTEQMGRLRSRRFIQDENHLIRDYLARLLQHAKVVLRREGLLEIAQLEYVLCVPVSWSPKACRTMHDAMMDAVQACRLDVLAPYSLPDLFIVSEPEAAAQYVIASLGSEGRLRQGEVFIILDAGGGTVDITTYKVTSDETGPLRLQGEAIAPDGAVCGSSLITERYWHAIRAKLNEVDPTEDRDVLDCWATILTNEWDISHKPRIDIADKRMMRRKPGGQQFVKEQVIQWTKEEICSIFNPSLDGTTDLLERQLQLAKEKNLIVNKLIVVGGFGESPSLRTRILQVLSTYSNCNGDKIEPIWPKDFPTSAVARGAVLRALDKRNGPSRISRSSFGFLRHERYGDAEEHHKANVKPTIDRVDHDEFVRDTIYWVIQAGQPLPSTFQTEPILSCHTFGSSEVRLICVEKLYTSQREQRSHFQLQHPENLGASLLSYVEIDVSDLRKEFPLELKANVGERTKVRNKFVRVVKFDLVIHVEGKQLKYEARWPPGANTPDEVRVRKSGLVSLAPSFAPGTE